MALSASWSDGRDDEESVADCLLETVGELRAFDAGFRSLYQARSGSKQPIVPFPGERSALVEHLRRNRIRNNTDRQLMPGAGFAATWDDNTRRFSKAQVSVLAGSKALRNTLTIDLPAEVVSQSTLEGMSGLFRRVVQITRADTAGVIDPSDPVIRNSRGQALPRLGWMHYRRASTTNPTNVEGVLIEQADGGTYYLIDVPVFDAESPEYRDGLERLRSALVRSGAVAV